MSLLRDLLLVSAVALLVGVASGYSAYRVLCHRLERQRLEEKGKSC